MVCWPCAVCVHQQSCSAHRQALRHALQARQVCSHAQAAAHGAQRSCYAVHVPSGKEGIDAGPQVAQLRGILQRAPPACHVAATTVMAEALDEPCGRASQAGPGLEQAMTSRRPAFRESDAACMWLRASSASRMTCTAWLALLADRLSCCSALATSFDSAPTSFCARPAASAAAALSVCGREPDARLHVGYLGDGQGHPPDGSRALCLQRGLHVLCGQVQAHVCLGQVPAAAARCSACLEEPSRSSQAGLTCPGPGPGAWQRRWH